MPMMLVRARPSSIEKEDTLMRAHSRDMSEPIRWGRIVAAAIMAEAGVFAVLLAAITAYTRFFAPGLSEEAYYALGEEIGYYVAPTAGAIMTILSMLWVARKLSGRFILHGVLVGVVEVLLTFWFIFGARPEHRLMYMVSFGLRIVGGYAGGVLARRRFGSTAVSSRDLTLPVQAS